jgi:hypothetical protein
MWGVTGRLPGDVRCAPTTQELWLARGVRGTKDWHDAAASCVQRRGSGTSGMPEKCVTGAAR